MTHLSKVVWREGMHLAQHHFQTQARYLEASLDFAFTRLFTAPYGVTELALDEATLRNGTAAIRHARGVMPDGLAFDMPESDAPPPPRRIADLVTNGDGDLLLLALPPYREGAANVVVSDGEAGISTSTSARFTAEPRRVHDDVLGRDVQSVMVGRKNFRLVLEREASGTDLVTLPLARVRRDASGTLAADPGYVPPSLHLGASPRVVSTLRRLLDLLDAKRAALTAERRPVTGVAAFGAHELSTFWLLHAINASIGPLRHLLTARQAHPERLYVELVRLCGALCTFGLASDPAALPAYDHERFGECLDELERHVRAHLKLAMPTGGIRVALHRTASGTFEGTIADRRALGPSRWILGVRAALGDASLVDRVPRLLKVCSGAGITKLVQRALPGMELDFLPVAPSSAAPRADTKYFSVVTDGPCWQHVQMTSTVGIHVPAEITNVELDLVILVDS